MRYKDTWPAKDYLDANPKVRPTFLAIAKQLADHGRIDVPERGHWLKGRFREILELKPWKHRLCGFRHKNTIYLTNGAPKKGKKEQEADYELALLMRADFFAKLT